MPVRRSGKGRSRVICAKPKRASAKQDIEYASKRRRTNEQ